MAVPVKNIFYLLCYAYGHAQDTEHAPSGAALGDRTENLFAYILSQSVERILKNSLGRRYIEEREDLRGVRGKIRLTETVGRSLMRKGILACQYEQLSADILENRILKSTIVRLGHHPRLKDTYRRRLADLSLRLHSIGDAPLNAESFRQLGKHPPRRDYDLPLQIARLMSDGALPTQGDDERIFIDFSADEARMGALFEDFIRGFVRIELPEATFLPTKSSWKVQGSEAAKRLVPELRRDIPLVFDGSRRIIECKFYTSPLNTGPYGTEKLRSTHLYQLFSYLVNDIPETEGLLLYAATDRELRLDFELTGRRIAVRTVDLNQSWPAIHQDLLRILAEKVLIAA